MEAETFNIPTGDEKAPFCCIVIGMAGSGKSTFISQLEKQAGRRSEEKLPYITNLDPAVTNVSYTPFIDIRNTIKIKDVMKNYNLGPNGAILTSLNLFSAQFDQVLHKMESKRNSTEMYIVDTPGQIEVFSWSASGTIISQMLSASFPSALVYVIDLARCKNPNTFMSNMLFCCSILYKLKLPMIVVFNKTDVADPEQVKVWLKDYAVFAEDLKKNETYLASLSRSLSLSLDDFYNDLNAVYLSSMTGDGFDSFFGAIEKAREEYYNVFLPDLEKRKQSNVAEKKRVEEEMAKFHNQVAQDKKGADLDKMYPNMANPNAGSQSLYQKKAQTKSKMEEVKEKFDEMKIEDENN